MTTPDVPEWLMMPACAERRVPIFSVFPKLLPLFFYDFYVGFVFMRVPGLTWLRIIKRNPRVKLGFIRHPGLVYLPGLWKTRTVLTTRSTSLKAILHVWVSHDDPAHVKPKGFYPERVSTSLWILELYRLYGVYDVYGFVMLCTYHCSGFRIIRKKSRRHPRCLDVFGILVIGVITSDPKKSNPQKCEISKPKGFYPDCSMISMSALFLCGCQG